MQASMLSRLALHGSRTVRLVRGISLTRCTRLPKGIFLSTGALFCRRQEHCFVDRSAVLSTTGTWFGRLEHYFVDRSIVLATATLFCRQEHGFVGRSMFLSSTRTMLVVDRSVVL